MIHPSLVRRDGRPIPETSAEIRLFACVRDEALRLPYFFKYYRELGIHRFFFVENNSSDGSLEFLLTQPDTHIFSSEESYAQSRCGVDWLNAMLREYALEQWALIVDADELLVYPGREHLSLEDFIAFVDAQQAQAVLTFLLDMYADVPIKNAVYKKGTPFLETCPYFDADTYELAKVAPFDQYPVRGGVRNRVFFHGHTHRGKPPVLSKIPLVKWRRTFTLEASTHLLRGALLAPVTGVLQHFKLFSDFVQNIIRETERKEHWDEAAQYSAYADVMKTNPDLNPMFPGSVRYRDSQQLVDLGLVRVPGLYPNVLPADL